MPEFVWYIALVATVGPLVAMIYTTWREGKK